MGKHDKMKTVSIRLPDHFIKNLDGLIKEDVFKYPNRSAVIRIALRDLFLKEKKPIV